MFKYLRINQSKNLCHLSDRPEDDIDKELIKNKTYDIFKIDSEGNIWFLSPMRNTWDTISTMDTPFNLLRINESN